MMSAAVSHYPQNRSRETAKMAAHRFHQTIQYGIRAWSPELLQAGSLMVDLCIPLANRGIFSASFIIDRLSRLNPQPPPVRPPPSALGTVLRLSGPVRV